MYPQFLWLDFRHNTSSAGLFEALNEAGVRRSGCKIDHPADLSAPIHDFNPQFLCFEFDIPLASDLDALQQTKLRHPELPILMITTRHSESLAVWAFRAGVWDYLVKPLSDEFLHARIASLINVCALREESTPRQRLLPPSGASCQLPQLATRPAQKTQLARAHLDAHYGEPVKLADMARLCHMSESEFSRFFKKEHGVNFCEYLLKLRVAKACELLNDNTVQVKTVAFNVGFNDVSYFTRVFRRYTGGTPSEYQVRT